MKTIITLILCLTTSSVAWGEILHGSQQVGDDSRLLFPRFDWILGSYYPSRQLKLTPNLGMSFDKHVGTLSTYVKPEHESNIPLPYSAWRITGQVLAGTLGSFVGMITGVGIDNKLSGCDADDENSHGAIFSCETDSTFISYTIPPIGSTLGVYFSGSHNHFYTFIGALAGSTIGFLTYRITLETGLTSNIDLITSLFLYNLTTSIGGTLGYYAMHHNFVRKKASNGLLIPTFGARRVGDKTEWIAYVSLVNVRF